MGKHKTVKETGTLSESLTSAKIDTESLAEEIRSWEENMSGTGLENTSKYEEVSSCADELENGDWDFVDSIIEEFEKDEKLGLKAELDKPVEVTFTKPYSKFESRPTRLARVLANLEAAQERLEAIKERIEGPDNEAEDEAEEDGAATVVKTEDDDIVSYIEGWIEDIDNMTGDLEGIMFPGMY